MNDDASPGADAGRRISTHGRRRGRKLRPGQKGLIDAALPARSIDLDLLRMQGPRASFPAAVENLWLEIGFGGGEHVVWQARHHPTTGIVACEVFQNGIMTCLRGLEAENLENVRLFTEDARDLLDLLPEQSIARAFILFPDPWPKSRHHKRRLISAATMDILARIMADGAELRLATDDAPYLRVMLAIACGHEAFEWLAVRPTDWRQRPEDWPQTRYEAKAIEAGRRPAFLRLRRRARRRIGS